MQYVICASCKRGYDLKRNRKCPYCYKQKDKMTKKSIRKKGIKY